MDRDRVVLAEILGPRGIRGEVLARSQTDVPGRLESLKQAWVRLAKGEDLAVQLENAWSHKNSWVLKFAGVDSINDAERFAGADLWVRLEERAKLPEGEYYQSDLIGCSVVEGADGEPVGVVTGWQEYGGPLLMVVESAKGAEVLIPFVKPVYQEVDLERRTIRVNLPEGLIGLN